MKREEGLLVWLLAQLKKPANFTTISANYYFYLYYFYQKNFNFSKISDPKHSLNWNTVEKNFMKFYFAHAAGRVQRLRKSSKLASVCWGLFVRIQVERKKDK